MLTMDEALDSLGAKFCTSCAAKLPVAGGQCAECGAIPALTRAELADALAEPGALAQAEAAERRAEAEHLRDQMMAKLREADRVEHVSRLRNARDRAQAALEDAHDRQRQAEAAVREAEKAEAAAAAPMREAYELHRKAAQDEEAARRFGKGVDSRDGCSLQAGCRQPVLERYRAPLQEANAAKETAQALAGAAAADVKAAEEARDAAVWGHEHPGYIPLSGETVNIPAQPLTRFSLGLDLDNTEISRRWVRTDRSECTDPDADLPRTAPPHGARKVCRPLQRPAPAPSPASNDHPTMTRPSSRRSTAPSSAGKYSAA